MMKIDFVIGSLVRGGAEHVISILANHYCDMGFDVNIILLLHGAVEYEINPKIKIVKMFGDTSNRFRRIPFWVSSLKKHFLTRNPDYVVSFVCRINLLVLYAINSSFKHINKPRVVISERNDPRFDKRGFVSKCLSHHLYPKADWIVVQSPEIQNQLPRSVVEKSSIVLNPIEKKASFVEPKDRKNIIISNGRITIQKNHILLIKGFQKFLEYNPNSPFVVHIYGNGELNLKLNKYISKHNLQNKVFIFPNTPLIQNKVAESKIFVLSSKYEGLSNSLMEAISLGVPSISTPVSGSSVVLDSSNGILLKSFKDVELARAIEKLTNLSEQEYFLKCSNSVKKSELFDCEKILGLYDEIIKGEKETNV